jgi:predicted O-methyltransferase YrrM
MLCYARPRPRFVVVDSFQYFPDQKEIVQTNLRSAGIDPAEVELRASKSEEALRSALEAGEQFAFVFIDANHQARHVIRDLRWAELLSVGGALCLHDYSARFPGVVWALDRFLRNNRNYRRVTLCNSLVILQKTSQGVDEEIGGLDVAIAEVLTQVHRLSRSFRKRLGQPV